MFGVVPDQSYCVTVRRTKRIRIETMVGRRPLLSANCVRVQKLVQAPSFSLKLEISSRLRQASRLLEEQPGKQRTRRLGRQHTCSTVITYRDTSSTRRELTCHRSTAAQMATPSHLEPGGQRYSQKLRSVSLGKRPGDPNENAGTSLASTSNAHSAGSLANSKNSNKTGELHRWSRSGRSTGSTSSDDSEENEAYTRLLRRGGSQHNFGKRTMKWCQEFWSRMTRRREPTPTRKLVISEPCRLEPRNEDISTSPKPKGDARNDKLGEGWEALGSHPVQQGESGGNHETPQERQTPAMLPCNHSRARSSSSSTTAEPAAAPRLSLTTPEEDVGKPKVTYCKSKAGDRVKLKPVAQPELLSPSYHSKGSWRQASLETRADFQRLQGAHKRPLAQTSRERDDGDRELSNRNMVLLRVQLAYRTGEARESAAKLDRSSARIAELEEQAHRSEEQLIQVAERFDPLLDVLDHIPEQLDLGRLAPGELRPHEMLLWAIGEVKRDHEKQLRGMHEAGIKEVEFYRKSCNTQAKRVLKMERELGMLKRELEGSKGNGRQRDRRSTPAAIWGTVESLRKGRSSAAAWTMLEVGGGHSDEGIQLIKLSSCPTWMDRAR